MKTLNKAKDKLINGGGLFMFLRSSVAAQAASWVDLGLGSCCSHGSAVHRTVHRHRRCGRRYNQLHNQLPVHVPRQGVSKRAVAVKYILIWTGSLLLNTYGTSMLYNLMSGSEFFAHMGFSGRRLLCRLTNLLHRWWCRWHGISFCMQKYFVYRP